MMMHSRRARRFWLVLTMVGLLTLIVSTAASASSPRSRRHTATYEVTVTNLTDGQPFSPPVAATHLKSVRMFQVDGLASDELEAIAEDGNPVPMFDRFDGARHVTDAVNVGMPLMPNGTTAGGFTDSTTFEITARPGDRFSIATMLICTNDGFTGLDAVKLPKSGSATFYLDGYDAGTERNTEESADIVDPCSALGPETLAGDPDGNEDAAVNTEPARAIHLHSGIQGGAELSLADHGWTNPVAVVTISLVN